jgi:hypothetical protein
MGLDTKTELIAWPSVVKWLYQTMGKVQNVQKVQNPSNSACYTHRENLSERTLFYDYIYLNVVSG